MKTAATILGIFLGLSYGIARAAEGQAPAAPVDTPAPSAAKVETAAGVDGVFGVKETVCKNGANVRRVKLGYADQKTGSDCKVSYLKETEEPKAEEKVLWNAQNDGKFCQDHAQTFVEKLKGQGWSCD